MKVKFVKLFLLFFLLNSLTICMWMHVSASEDQQACFSPNVPDGGECWENFLGTTSENINSSTKPCDVSKKHLPGDEIIYSCHETLVLTGNRNRTCTVTGEWTGVTPFCDKPTKIKEIFMSALPDIVGNTSCSTWLHQESDLLIPLSENTSIKRLELYDGLFPEILVHLNVSKRTNETCGSFTLEEELAVEYPQIGFWYLIECQINQNPTLLVRRGGESDSKSGMSDFCGLQIFDMEEKPVNITSAPYFIFIDNVKDKWTDGNVLTCHQWSIYAGHILIPLTVNSSLQALRIYIERHYRPLTIEA